MHREEGSNSSLDCFFLLAFPNSFHLGNWYHFLMASVTLHYPKHSWTAASRQSRLIKTGTTKNIWVTNKQLLLLINGGVSVCASGCKILLLLRQSREEPSPGSLRLFCPPSLASAMSVRAKSSSTSITLYPSHLGVCLFVSQPGSYRSPHYL